MQTQFIGKREIGGIAPGGDCRTEFVAITCRFTCQSAAAHPVFRFENQGVPAGGFQSMGRRQPAETGADYCVDRVPEEDTELLKFLVELNILPNRKITIVDASRHRGVITVRTESGEDALGYGVAARIWVRPWD